MSRGPERCQVGMAKRRGRGGGGGGIPRRGKPRDDHDSGPYSQGKCQRVSLAYCETTEGGNLRK